MRHIRMRVFGLAVAAALTLAAFLASNAMALPEWGICEAKAEGRYSDSGCTHRAKKVGEKFTGEFEWRNTTTFQKPNANDWEFGTIVFASTPMTLTSTFVKCEPNEEPLAKCREGETEQREPITVECEQFASAGVYSRKSPKEIYAYHQSFKGCKALGLDCANAREERLQTGYLKGTLGYIKKATPKEVGIDWRPESGKELVKFSCGEALSIVLGGATEKEGPFYPPKGGGGAMIAKVTPIDEMGETLTEEFKRNAETDANVPNSFEGGSQQLLEDYFTNRAVAGKGSKWSPAGLEATPHEFICGELCSRPIEIKA